MQPAYALAAALGGRWPLVAGGPHATICPDEPLGHGFRFVVRGEGEEALRRARRRDRRQARASATSGALSWIDRGMVRHNPSRGFLLELDALAAPTSALDLFDPAWYGATRALPPAGLLSSRGCPAACTFCSNNVTGRRFRYRSPASVAAEVALLRERFGLLRLQLLRRLVRRRPPPRRASCATRSPPSARCTGPAPRTRRTSIRRPCAR